MKYALMFAAIFLGVNAQAQFDSRVAVSLGGRVETATVTGSSIAGTAFVSAGNSSLDIALFNNTAVAVWIGTTATTIHGTNHSNVTMGFPVTASATFRLNGSMSGAMYVTCGVEVATCNLRVFEAKIK